MAKQEQNLSESSADYLRSIDYRIGHNEARLQASTKIHELALEAVKKLQDTGSHSEARIILDFASKAANEILTLPVEKSPQDQDQPQSDASVE